MTVCYHTLRILCITNTCVKWQGVFPCLMWDELIKHSCQIWACQHSLRYLWLLGIISAHKWYMIIDQKALNYKIKSLIHGEIYPCTAAASHWKFISKYLDGSEILWLNICQRIWFCKMFLQIPVYTYMYTYIYIFKKTTLGFVSFAFYRISMQMWNHTEGTCYLHKRYLITLDF